MEKLLSGPHEIVLLVANKTLIVCQDHYITSKGIWHNDNPLHFSTPLLLLQLSLISIVSRLIDFCLKPLGQSCIVSQIIGGLILGPSLLGHGIHGQGKELALALFPARGSIMIEMIATFGIMFFFFSIGVKMDPIMMFRPERKAVAIGLSVFLFTLILPNILSGILKAYLPMDVSLKNSLSFLATTQSISAFPVIACLLSELKILNTDMGRLAVSSAMICDAIGISLTAIIFSISGSKGNHLTAICSISSYIVFMAVVLLIVRPAVLRMFKNTPEAKSVNEAHILQIFVLVLVSGYVSEIIGQHFVLGPLILGLAMPDGPPLGAALESKLKYLVAGLLYPTYLAVSGLKTDVFKIHIQSAWIVGIVVLFSLLVKIGAVLLPAIYSGMPIQEAFVLGLVLNAKGINEIVIYNLWRQAKILSDQEFALSVISVAAVTAIVTPLIRLLYDPSKKFVSSVNKSSIQNSKRSSDFRILVGIHNQENVPTIINLLQVSDTTKQRPVIVIGIHLVELIGRTSPMISAYEPQEQQSIHRSSSRSTHIFNALQHYELHSQNYATVQLFTAMSHFGAMHSDICQMALIKRATIVIVPFHKQWEIDGSIGSVNRAIQNMNIKILEKAPCSVGILIDRGILNGSSSSFLTSHSLYRVAMLFMGGSDDAESLTYAARMADHRSVKLTLIRFILFEYESITDSWKQDINLITQFRKANAGNEHFVYVEKVVRDGEDLAALIKRMEDSFDLIIVGRNHQQCSVLSALDDWSDCPELGVIGDMLASPDFGRTASVLVVQQSRKRKNMTNRGMQSQLINYTDKSNLPLFSTRQ